MGSHTSFQIPGIRRDLERDLIRDMSFEIPGWDIERDRERSQNLQGDHGRDPGIRERLGLCV